MFNPFHPLLIPPQPCIPTFFGKYTNTPSADQSTSLSALTSNDLQIGVGTANNTGSNVNFAEANMKHVNGLAVVNLNAKTVPQTYYYDGNTGKASSVRAASTTTATVWPSVNFSSSTKPYIVSNTSSLKKYLAIVKPSTATTISTTATSGCEAWSLAYNVSQNTSSSQSVTSSRPGYYLGWVYSYKGAVETFTASEAGTYKLEAWGAQGGGYAKKNKIGGYGGYSNGLYSTTVGKVLWYVCIGSQGQNGTHTDLKGGFNGGGNSNLATWSDGNVWGSSGGGCTSIQKSLQGNGELRNYSSNQSDIIIVAGGGGGAGGNYALDPGTNGGAGGGEVGGNGDKYSDNIYVYQGYGGTQNKCGTRLSTLHNSQILSYGEFGKGGDGSSGAGGGLYGGGSDHYSTGGGSGYINTSILTDASTITGNISFPSPSGGTETGHSGNGYAIITQVSY